MLPTVHVVDDYPWDVGRTESEEAFLRRLETRYRAGRLPALLDAWTHFTQLVVTLDVSDPDEHAILRTLRVDFDGQHLVGGNDPTHQMTEVALNHDDPDFFRLDGPLTAEEFADHAYDWFRQQGQRPIDRHEWDGPEHGWVEWVLTDVGRAFSGRYLGRPDRAPDRVIRVKRANT